MMRTIVGSLPDIRCESSPLAASHTPLLGLLDLRSRKRQNSNIIALLLLVTAPIGYAQVIEYPLGGNIRAEQGTLEMWFKLAAEPDPSQKQSLHYFPMFWFKQTGEDRPRASLNYQTVWKPDHFHFNWNSTGRAIGEFASDAYIATAEETQAATKADALSPGGRYPRTPRLKKDDWHYLAITWTDGLTKPKYSMFLDGRQVLLTATLNAVWWDDLDTMVLAMLGAPYHDNYALDELRLSSTARAPEEIAQIHASGKPPAGDMHTLLLDHLDTIDRQEPEAGKPPVCSTVAEQISGFTGEKGGRLNGLNWDVTDGRFGKAVVITGANREHK